MQPEEDIFERILNKRLKYGYRVLNLHDWSEIASELNIENCKEVYHDAIKKYRITQHKFFTLHKDLLELDFCSENYDRVCQLCLQIYDESHTDDHTNLLDLIQSTLSYEIIDLTTHSICKKCHSTINSFNIFRKQCIANLQLLKKVSSEISAPFEEETDFQNEDEQLLLTTPKAIITSSSGLIIDPIKITVTAASDKSKIRKSKVKHKNNLNQLRTPRGTICQVCGKVVKGIQTHMLIHQGIKKFECKICKKTFIQSGQLKRHVNSHLNIRNYKCPHKDCEKTFVDPSSVTKHLVVHNKDQKNFVCTLCGARFNRLGTLRYHEKTHRDERNHKCNLCEKSFLAKYDLTKHYRTHTKEKPYSCAICSKKFSISKNAKVHLRVHTKEKSFNCSFCDLNFSYQSSLKQHIIKMHKVNENRDAEIVNQ